MFGVLEIATTSQQTAEKKSFLDSLTNVLNVAQKGADIYSQVKSPSGSSSSVPGYIPAPTFDNNAPLPPAPAQNNTIKYLLIGGGVLAVGTIIYLVAKKKKGKK